MAACMARAYAELARIVPASMARTRNLYRRKWARLWRLRHPQRNDLILLRPRRRMDSSVESFYSTLYGIRRSA